MHKTQKQVLEFLKGADLQWSNDPGVGSYLNFYLLRSLVAEEANEFFVAMSQLQFHIELKRDNCSPASPYNTHRENIIHWWSEAIDAMCDLIVVIHNTSNAMGIDLEPFFDEVHRTNMNKLDGPKNEHGKLMKPEGWQPPRIKEMLEELLNEDDSQEL